MTGEMPFWLQLLGGLGLGAILLFFAPSAIRLAKESPGGSGKDWLGALLPLGGVVLVVILLIALARG